MTDIQSLISDLNKLNLFYFGLETDLGVILQGAETESEHSLMETILQNRTRLAQVERMNAHILKLAEDLKISRDTLDAETRNKVDNLTAEAKSHAIHVQELCTNASEKIEATKETLQREIEGIGRGKKYLKSVDPVKNNYPKFIDSTG